ncbi:sarcoplasmic reticulum histidine-rich calcium-binding protein [Drosophila rhopaloa]|uniref:Sarcoplasmic reticulum histidine-rich calcium-binding protein n=1 Tax=Drosophila rhopaloa TaxID=1041015 RepID=A0A6P4FNC3_DRORH|nr:sarcoplasmic reticulum histidine-rich calcium-binding protein [Drosophila rhopaloa]
MKSIIILLALVAFCQAAPLEVKESSSEALSRPSPISPDVISDPKPPAKVVLLKDTAVLNREKRDEAKKPDNEKAPESLQHNAPAPSPFLVAHHEDAHKHKREAHHEEGHKEEPQKEEVKDAPEVPEPKKEKREAHHEEGHKEEPQKEEVKDAPEVPEPKKEKREAHHEEGHKEEPQKEEVKDAPEVPEPKKEKREAHHEEGHKDDDKPQVEDLSLPHALPTDAHTAELPKKQEKRETVEKPDSVKARESIQHKPQHSEDLTKAIESLTGGKAPEQRHQRDIPVPTQTKATAAPAETTKSEAGSTTPSTHHLNIPHPIPVAELFEKNKKSSSSSEESKESKEKVKA